MYRSVHDLEDGSRFSVGLYPGSVLLAVANPLLRWKKNQITFTCFALEAHGRAGIREVTTDW